MDVENQHTKWRSCRPGRGALILAGRGKLTGLQGPRIAMSSLGSRKAQKVFFAPSPHPGSTVLMLAAKGDAPSVKGRPLV